MDLKIAFQKLRKVLAETGDTSIPKGIGGMWTPDAKETNGDLIRFSYAGGFEQHLFSNKFDFALINTEGLDGEVVTLHGKEADVEACLEFYGI